VPTDIAAEICDRRIARACAASSDIATLDDAVAAFNPTKRISGKTIIRVRP
jgi:hypothetical protein